MRLTESFFLLLICIVAVALCLHGWFAVGHSPLVIAAPATLALVLVALSALRILRTLKVAGGEREAELQRDYWLELRGSLRPLLWSLSAAPLILLFGYPLGLTIYTGLFARNFGSSWLGALLAAGFAVAVVWGAAVEIFGLPIPLLPGWLS